MTTPSATCPFCLKVTHHPSDIANQYCNNCKCFYGDIIAHANIAENARDEAITALRRVVEVAHDRLKDKISGTIVSEKSPEP